MDNVLSLEVYISSGGFCRELVVSKEEGDKRIGLLFIVSKFSLNICTRIASTKSNIDYIFSLLLFTVGLAIQRMIKAFSLKQTSYLQERSSSPIILPL